MRLRHQFRRRQRRRPARRSCSRWPLVFDLSSENALVVGYARGDRLFLPDNLNLGTRSRLAGFSIHRVDKKFAVLSSLIDHDQVRYDHDRVRA